MIEFYNGYKIPKLGLGTFKLENDSDTKKLVLKALEVGYRSFDTAMMYGNEEALGDAIKESKIDRSEIFITTKLMYHHSYEETVKKINESIKKLNVEYIDLLLIHWPNHDPKVNAETWKVFEKYYEEGFLKAIGVSNFTRYQMDELLKTAVVKPMVNQIEIHPGLSQIPTIKYLEEKDIRIMAYGPLMRGHLDEEPFNSILSKIAFRHNKSISQIAIAWGVNRGTIMIPKTSNSNRLLENFVAKNIILSKSEMLEIDNLNVGRRMYSDPSNNIYGKFIK